MAPSEAEHRGGRRSDCPLHVQVDSARMEPKPRPICCLLDAKDACVNVDYIACLCTEGDHFL